MYAAPAGSPNPAGVMGPEKNSRQAALIEFLLPAPMASAERYEDVPGDTLFPSEHRVISGAGSARRREFATVRACARTALGQLGIPAGPILPGDEGAPRWPRGVVGSMTHCAGYRAAAVARRSDIAAVGIDAEPDAPIPIRVRARVTVAEERTHLAELGVRRPGVSWDRLLFSAKESVFKAWYPWTGRWLEFDQVVVTLSPDDGTFHARLLVPGPRIGGGRLRGFTGGWTRRRNLLLTAVSVAPVIPALSEQPLSRPSGRARPHAADGEVT
ncbi:4'-phosphopantetheinyl transferase [Streptomyces xanthochromogenes]|uniref:4'-phosphopantetheinyl transferase n=1 Tax=Streptomyces xanthochromogenes TaxID=67384 RepID=UPI0037A6A469